MPTTLPPNGNIVRANGPMKCVQGGRFDYDSASGTYSLCRIPPDTFVENVSVFIVTTWSGGGAACMFIGDSLVTACYFPMVTIGTAGGYHSFRSTQANALGTYYPSQDDITLIYTIDTSDTRGILIYYVTMLYLPDLNNVTLVSEIT